MNTLELDNVKGPATTLAAYLHKLGWELTVNATLLGPGGLRVNLSTHSNKQIKQQLAMAWDRFCHAQIQHRQGVVAQPFDSLTTRRFVDKLSERQRGILALTMTAGWQSNGGLAQWSQHTTRNANGVT